MEVGDWVGFILASGVEHIDVPSHILRDNWEASRALAQPLQLREISLIRLITDIELEISVSIIQVYNTICAIYQQGIAHVIDMQYFLGGVGCYLK